MTDSEGHSHNRKHSRSNRPQSDASGASPEHARAQADVGFAADDDSADEQEHTAVDRNVLGELQAHLQARESSDDDGESRETESEELTEDTSVGVHPDVEHDTSMGLHSDAADAARTPSPGTSDGEPAALTPSSAELGDDVERTHPGIERPSERGAATAAAPLAGSGAPDSRPATSVAADNDAAEGEEFKEKTAVGPPPLPEDESSPEPPGGAEPSEAASADISATADEPPATAPHAATAADAEPTAADHAPTARSEVGHRDEPPQPQDAEDTATAFPEAAAQPADPLESENTSPSAPAPPDVAAAQPADPLESENTSPSAPAPPDVAAAEPADPLESEDTPPSAPAPPDVAAAEPADSLESEDTPPSAPAPPDVAAAESADPLESDDTAAVTAANPDAAAPRAELENADLEPLSTEATAADQSDGEFAPGAAGTHRGPDSPADAGAESPEKVDAEEPSPSARATRAGAEAPETVDAAGASNPEDAHAADASTSASPPGLDATESPDGGELPAVHDGNTSTSESPPGLDAPEPPDGGELPAVHDGNTSMSGAPADLEAAPGERLPDALPPVHDGNTSVSEQEDERGWGNAAAAAESLGVGTNVLPRHGVTGPDTGFEGAGLRGEQSNWAQPAADVTEDPWADYEESNGWRSVTTARRRTPEELEADAEKPEAAADDPNAPKLVGLGGEAAELRFTLSKGGADVGRSPEKTICLDNGSVSRNHATIEYRDGAFHVRDLKSANGTFVNGERITQRTLAAGDTLRFGRLQFRFESPQSQPAEPREPREPREPDSARQNEHAPDAVAPSRSRPRQRRLAGVWHAIEVPWRRLSAGATKLWTRHQGIRLAVLSALILALTLGTALLLWVHRSGRDTVEYRRAEVIFDIFLQGRDAFRRHAWTQASKHFETVLELEPRHARAQRYIEEIKRERTFERMLARARKHYSERQLLEAHTLAQQIEDSVYSIAANELLHAIEAELDARVGRARTSIRAARYEEAAKLLRAVEQVQPGRPDVRALSQQLQREKQREEATASEADDSQQEAGESPEPESTTAAMASTSFVKAKEAFAKGDLERAASIVAEADDTPPVRTLKTQLDAFVEAYSSAVEEYRAKRSATAIELLQRAKRLAGKISGGSGALSAELDERLADMHYVAGIEAAMEKDLARAYSHHRDALRYEPEHERARNGLADLASKAERLYAEVAELSDEEARDRLDLVLRIVPPSHSLYDKARQRLSGLQ